VLGHDGYAGAKAQGYAAESVTKMLKMGRTNTKENKEEDDEDSSDSSSSSDSDASTSTIEEEENQEEEEEDRKEEETWVQWMIRTAHVAATAMEKAKVPDWVQEQKRRKWRWAGHASRREDMRWSYRMIGWVPTGQGSRSVGRPMTRWEDSIEHFAIAKDFKWIIIAQDRQEWRRLEDEFVAFRK